MSAREPNDMDGTDRIQASVMRSLTPLLLAGLLSVPSLRAQDTTRSYTIPGAEAWDAARRAGFEFHPVIPDDRHLLSGRRDGVATTLKACDSATEPCVVVARIERGALVVVEPDCERCERAHDFTLFDGHTLAEGWTVREVRLDGNGWSWVRRPATDTDRLAFTVRVTAASGAEAGVTIDEITLLGPPGADWRDAFAP